MTSETWADWPFAEVIDFQEGPGIFAKDFRSEGVPLVRLAGLERGGSVLTGCDYLDQQMVAARWAHFGLNEGDILLSTSASLGRIAVVGADAIGAIAYTGIIRMRPRDQRLHAPFIRYLLEAPDFQEQAEMVGVGSVIRHFGPMHLRQMRILLPPIPDQHAIVEVLGALDDKIEVNDRLNATLDEMARMLFKSWFVAFDPVHAKAAGRQPLGMDAVTAALFPDSFEDSAVGLIPTGWRTSRVGDELELAYGRALKSSDRNPGSVVVMGANGPIGWHDTALVKGPGVVVGRKGNPGVVRWVSQDFYPIDTTFYVIPRGELTNEFLYRALAAQDLASLAADSAVPGINRNFIYGNNLLVPPQGVVKAFTEAARDLWQLATQNEEESVTLAELRKTLLPKLISGEFRIGEAARGVEAVV